MDTTRLAQPVDLSATDRWNVGVCEFTPLPTEADVFASLTDMVGKTTLIYCDLISQQFVGVQYVRCIRTVMHPSTNYNRVFANVYYVPVEERRSQDIRIEILTLKD